MTPATPTILDGGLATWLEALGADLSGSLWSAQVLRSDPSLVTRAHADFFAAGAQVATTATYQLTPMSLSRSAVDPATFGHLTQVAVEAARAARDDHGVGWVVGSVGPYGASQADGSEYTGDYDLPEERDRALALLREHHRPRLVALCDNDIDALALETIPSLLEVEALAAELAALGADVPAWFSVTPAAGGLTTRTGDPLGAVTEAAAAYSPTIAVGVNCCPPADVAPAMAALDPAAYRLDGVAYPNSGETWDARARVWRGSAAWDEGAVGAWRSAGATMIGGCCRVLPDQIARLTTSTPPSR